MVVFALSYNISFCHGLYISLSSLIFSDEKQKGSHSGGSERSGRVRRGTGRTHLTGYITLEDHLFSIKEKNVSKKTKFSSESVKSCIFLLRSFLSLGFNEHLT